MKEIYSLKNDEIIELINIAHTSSTKSDIKIRHGIGQILVSYTVDNICYYADIDPWGCIEVYRESDNKEYLKTRVAEMLNEEEK